MLVTWRYRFRNSLIDLFDPRARWIFSLAFLIAATMFWDELSADQWEAARDTAATLGLSEAKMR